MITPGLYKHYKGKYYEVLFCAKHSETLEDMVVYKALYNSDFGNETMWVRPEKMFHESLMHEGKEVKRFEFLTSQSENQV